MDKGYNGDFVHLHVLTEYSPGRSIAKIRELVSKAKSLGMQYLAITDAGNMEGVPTFCVACAKEGIKPIIGSELQVLCKGDKDKKTSPMVVLAYKQQGYYNLLQLVSASSMRHKQENGQNSYFRKDNGFVTREELQTYHEGLVLLSGGSDSEINKALLEGDYAEATSLVQEWAKVYFKNFYLEIQNHGRPEEKFLNQLLQKLGQENDIELVATNEVSYVEKEDAELLALAQILPRWADWYGRADYVTNLSIEANKHLCSGSELQRLAEEYPEAVDNTLKLAKFLVDSLWLNDYSGPMNNNNWGEEELYCNREKNDEDYDIQLKAMCEARLARYYPHADAVIKLRLAIEIKTIIKLERSRELIFASNCLQSIRQHGMRAYLKPGAVYGSLIAYLLGLVPTDPVKWQLEDKEFLNELGKNDLFATLNGCAIGNYYLGNMISSLEMLFGKGRVVATVVVPRRNMGSALCGMLMGIYSAPEGSEELLKFCGQEYPVNRLGTNEELDAYIEQIRGLKEFLRTNKFLKKIFSYAWRLDGLPRMNRAGFDRYLIILPKEKAPEQYLPTMPSLETFDEKYPKIVSQYSARDAIAWDFNIYHWLHSPYLGVLDELADIFVREGEKIDFENIPLDDQEVYNFLSSGNFIESSYRYKDTERNELNIIKKRLLMDLKPRNLNDLMAYAAMTVSAEMLRSGIPSAYLQMREKESLEEEQDFFEIFKGRPNVISKMLAANEALEMYMKAYFNYYYPTEYIRVYFNYYPLEYKRVIQAN